MREREREVYSLFMFIIGFLQYVYVFGMLGIFLLFLQFFFFGLFLFCCWQMGCECFCVLLVFLVFEFLYIGFDLICFGCVFCFGLSSFLFWLVFMDVVLVQVLLFLLFFLQLFGGQGLKLLGGNRLRLLLNKCMLWFFDIQLFVCGDVMLF